MFNIKIHDNAFKELSELPDELRGKMFQLIKKLETNGQLKMPSSKSLGAGLFELRAIERNNIARCLYVYQQNNTIYILYSFVKKTQKTPANALKIAQERIKEMSND
ncbi:type II toxin-antitoxin system RelE/ParE family toxin [Gilliamella sp. Pas-s95]|uniref:type II toxin-antitoxin system RelE/ParE family toxin n=1 Tax=Gilliamella sp. Pas-s95 TaxID=2687317 RepID=UPI0013293EE3|nr:type II toxin-antitoxin system RelE/ParE family toxin [Gilliamella sp. Pas-s95]MWN05654.1 type II toxin-antitoxin system RelE/ParE family toxin [Gilliamella sp. Pas-s95]